MWTYYQPVKVIFGEGELENVGKYLLENGMGKAFIIADPYQMIAGNVKRITDASNGAIVGAFSEVEPNPTIENVHNAAQAAKMAGADSIIAIGGGSAMDCAKAAGVVLGDGIEAEELLRGHEIRRSLPVMAIPTTAGTGSEVTAGAVLSDPVKQIKAAIFSPEIFPKVALVDPVLTWTMPEKVTAACGLDVLAHSFDAMASVKATKATDALALCAAKLAIASLTKAVRDGSNKEARAAMAKASLIAGLAFSQTGTTGSHACSYILTAKYHMPHGEACAFTLDAWLEENARVKPELNGYAAELGFSDIHALSSWLNDTKKAFGMRTRLSELGVSEKDLDEIVDSSMTSANMANNIAHIGREDLKKLFMNKL